MKKYDTKDIRNVALVSHGGAGKTSLAEAFLYDAKVTTRLGSVDEGNSSLDCEPEEMKRKITLSTALASFEWKKVKVNVLDTPGDTNFFVDTRAAMAVADGAVLVVSAPDGVQVGTEKVWQYAEELALPLAVFVSKMDRERADFDACLAGLIKTLSPHCAALQLPIGKEAGFAGVVDVLAQKAYRFTGDGREVKIEDVPADLADALKKAREALIERVAESDDALMTKYLETFELAEEEIATGLQAAIGMRKLFPVLCGAGARNLGAQPLLDLIANAFPSPATCPPMKGKDAKDADAERKPDEAEPLSAQVFKSIGADIGRLSLLRVYSGKLVADANILNSTRDAKERAGSLYVLVGKKRETIPEVAAGDLIALAKLKDTRTGDTLCDEKAPVKFPEPQVPNPVISFALKPKSKGDEDKVATKLNDILAEDPALKITRDQASKEILLSGMGQGHVEVAVEKLKRLGVEVDLLPPKVPYLESIKGRIKGVEGKHKKQTGGRGQFGVCYLDMEPNPRGTGFEFVDAIFGGAIPRQFIPSVEKGIRDRMSRGVVAGFPVVDVKVTLVDGKYHDVDSDSRSFEFAGSKGFQAAFKQCKPILLEPIMKLEITCPDENMGDIMGDINQKRGRVLGMDARGRNQVIMANVPMSECLKYAADLRSMTAGRGTFTMEQSHYDELPSNLAEKIMAEAKVAEEEE
ncbi:MAG: elongation factor G [Deltaproteobacteria bacterium]|nr:elongation factor G [Deltaproteobacteria bacterium]